MRSLRRPSHASTTRWTAKLLLGAAALGLGAAGFALAGKSRLLLTSKGPVPATVSVAWGDTLEVKNADGVAHTLASAHRELQGVIQPGQTYTTAFTSGTRAYDYRQTGGKAYPGKVVVSFLGYVSLQVSRSLVAYGRTVRLSGHSSLHSTPVAVEVRRGGAVRWRVLRTFASDAGGAFAGAVRLERGGKLRATIAAGRIRSRMRAGHRQSEDRDRRPRRNRVGPADARASGLADDPRVPTRSRTMEAPGGEAAERLRGGLVPGSRRRARGRARRGEARRRRSRLHAAEQPSDRGRAGLLRSA